MTHKNGAINEHETTDAREHTLVTAGLMSLGIT